MVRSKTGAGKVISGVKAHAARPIELKKITKPAVFRCAGRTDLSVDQQSFRAASSYFGMVIYNQNNDSNSNTIIFG